MTQKKKYRENIVKARWFFKNDIWELDTDSLGKKKARFVRYLRMVILAIKNHSKQGIGWQAVSLSFFTTMAFVPFVAVLFAISNYFGLGEYLMELIYKNFGHPEIMDYVMDFANNIIAFSQEGIYGIISFLIFVWLIIWLMICVERSFNNVWKTRISRSLWRRLAYYFITIVSAPFVIMIFLTISLTIADGINIIGLSIPLFDSVSKFLVWVIFGAFMTLGLTGIYMMIPNTKVRFAPAFSAAVIAAIAFTAVQILYLETQVLISRMNAVYGIFAAIPLFMVWLNIGWFIVLFGSSLSYSFQNIDNYPLEEIKTENN